MLNYSRNALTGTVNFGGLHFLEHRFADHLSSLPGLYCVCKRVGLTGLEPLYVGETHDLNNRVGAGIANHHKFLMFRICGATHVCTAWELGGKDERLLKERRLIDLLRPPLNDTPVGAASLSALGRLFT